MVHRRNLSKSIQLSRRLDVWRQDAHPVALSALASVEGDGNFQEHHQLALGGLESRAAAGGATPDPAAWGVAIEKHTRGHMLQINVTNSFATTYGQIARGGDGHNVSSGSTSRVGSDN